MDEFQASIHVTSLLKELKAVSNPFIALPGQSGGEWHLVNLQQIVRADYDKNTLVLLMVRGDEITIFGDGAKQLAQMLAKRSVLLDGTPVVDALTSEQQDRSSS
jgi:hypothetical protein